MPKFDSTEREFQYDYDSTGLVPAAAQLQSIEVARVVHLISEGECVGLADGTNPGKSVFFKNTALQDAVSGLFNYPNIKVEQRFGTASQTYVPGFSAAEASFSVNSEVKAGAPVTRTTSSSNIDAVRVDVQFPVGLQSVDDSGTPQPTSVSVQVSAKLTSSGTWVAIINDGVTGKAEPGFEKSYYVPRPSGSGTWDIKVERLTADAVNPARVSDKTTFYRLTEIQDVKQTYPHSAYVALSYDARTAPDASPQTFDFIGILCAVPSNYNAATRVYTGVPSGAMSATKTWSYNSTTRMWDHTTTGTLYWTDNPVWHLYDLLTNKRYGAGDFIDPAGIDFSSFYAASVYCDELVPVTTATGTVYEPRFRFNSQLTQMDDMWKMVQMLASTFNAVVYSSGGLIKLVQDRPTAASVLVTKSNISEEGFSYSSSDGSTRHTAARVAYNDLTNGWQQTSVLYYDDSTSYPYNVTDIVAWGCTSEGQARRVARWAVDTELRNTDMVSYRAPLSHVNVEPGTVIKVMDTDYANSLLAAKVVSATSTTVTLDRPVTITSGTNLIDVLLADGKTTQQRTVANGPGSYTVLSVTAAFSQTVPPGADVIVSGNIVPRLFRVVDIKEDKDGFFEVSALQYDPTKYSRVETGVSTTAQVFSDTTRNTVPGPVTGLTVILQAASAVDTVFRDLYVSWTRPTDASKFTVQYRKRGEAWTQLDEIGTAFFTIENVTTGTYDINVYSISKWGLPSPVVSTSYGVDLSGSTTPVVASVTGLSVLGGGTSFTGQDLTVVWTNPSSNLGKNPAVKDFVVKVYTTGGTLLRTETVPTVQPGTTQTYTYTFSKNLDDGGPRRSVRIDVQTRDALNALASAAAATLSNPAPAALSSIALVGGIGNIKISFAKPADTDLKGVLVWRSTTSGFTPASGNLLYDTGDNYLSDQADFGTTYYYKLAAYDTFSKPLDGSGLNVSSQISGAALAGAGIPEVSSLPSPTGYTGPSIVYNQTDGQLYSYVGGAWQATIPPVSGIADGSVTIAKFASTLRPIEVLGSLPTTGNVTGRIVLLTGDGKLYRYDGSAFIATVPSTDITGTLSDSQLAAIAAAKITGTIVASQIADSTLTTAKFASGIEPVGVVSSVPGTLSTRVIFNTTDGKAYRWNGTSYVSSVPAVDITGTLSNSQIADLAAAKLTGQITTTQITDSSISTAKIAAGAITAAKIAADTITANEIASGAITTAELAAGSVTTTKLTTGAVTANEIASNAIIAGKIAAGAVSATEISAGAITTSKLLVTGQGAALNDDPSFIDASAWTGTFGAAPSYTTITDGVSNRSAARFTNAGAIQSRVFPLAPGRTYRVSAYLRRTSGSGFAYIRLWQRDGANTSGTYIVPTSTGNLESFAPSTTWTRYVGTVTTDSTTVSGYLELYANYNTTGVTDLQDFRVEEAIAASLIVDGTITGSKIAANTITAANIAADTITASQIAANAITVTELSAGAVTTAKLAAGAVTANELGANSVVAGKIQAGAISAAEIAAGAIRTDKLLVTSRGQALNDDPAVEDISAWSIQGPGVSIGIGTDATGSVGANYFANSTGSANAQVFSRPLVIDPQKVYFVSANLYVAGGNDRNMYIFVDMYDGAGNRIPGGDISPPWGGTLAGYVYGYTPPEGVFTRCGGQIGPGTGRVIPAHCRSVKIGVWFQYNGFGSSSVLQAAQDIRIERANDGNLLVDGTITAAKVAAGTLTANEIAANTITGGKIAASTITSSNIAANTITASNIAADTITGDRLVAGTVTASRIDTRDLTIKNSAGTVVFSAAVPLTASYADNALRNSSITVDSAGVLQGAGTSGVTVNNSVLPLGANVLYNADFSNGLNGWSLVNSGIAIGAQGVNLNSDYQLVPAGAPGSDVLYAYQSNRTGDSNNYCEWQSPPIPVEVGKRYVLSAYTGAHRATVIIFAYLYDAAGTIFTNTYGISGTSPYNAAEAYGGKTIDTFKRISSYGDMPSGTAFIRLMVRKLDTNSGSSNSYMFVARCQVEEVAANTTVPGPWASSGYTDQTSVRALNPITAANASTYIASAAIDIAQIKTASIGSLSALSAELGNAVISSSGSLKSGQTAYNTGTGFWIGMGSGTPKLSIGNPAGNNLRWDGAELLINAKFDTYSASASGGSSSSVSNGAISGAFSSTATPSGGLASYTYNWTLAVDYPYITGEVAIEGGANSATVYLKSSGTNQYNDAYLTCYVTDSNGRVAMATKFVRINHGTPGTLP
jgi:hypothetical protein